MNMMMAIKVSRNFCRSSVRSSYSWHTSTRDLGDYDLDEEYEEDEEYDKDGEDDEDEGDDKDEGDDGDGEDEEDDVNLKRKTPPWSSERTHKPPRHQFWIKHLCQHCHSIIISRRYIIRASCHHIINSESTTAVNIPKRFKPQRRLGRPQPILQPPEL